MRCCVVSAQRSPGVLLSLMAVSPGARSLQCSWNSDIIFCVVRGQLRCSIVYRNVGNVPSAGVRRNMATVSTSDAYGIKRCQYSRKLIKSPQRLFGRRCVRCLSDLLLYARDRPLKTVSVFLCLYNRRDAGGC